MDFPASYTGLRSQLMVWSETNLAQHGIYVSTVLTAVHDDGSHTAEGRTNWLRCLAGVPHIQMDVAEYLGIRMGAEHVKLKKAAAVWYTMPLNPLLYEMYHDREYVEAVRGTRFERRAALRLRDQPPADGA